jgi:hypothetical protein
VVRSDQKRIIELDEPKLDEEIDKLTEQLEKLKKEKNTIESKKSDIEKELDKTKNDLQKLQKENEKYLSEIRELEQNNKKNLKEIKELKEKIAGLEQKQIVNSETDIDEKIVNLITSHEAKLKLLKKDLESKEEELLEKDKLFSDMKEQTQKEIQNLTKQIENFNNEKIEILTMMNKFQINSQQLFDRAETYNISELETVALLPNKLRLTNDLNIPAEFPQNKILRDTFMYNQITQESNIEQIFRMINSIEESINRYQGNEKTDDIRNIINIIRETLRNRIFNNNIKDKMEEHINNIQILCNRMSNNESNKYFCNIYDELSVLLKKIQETFNVIDSDSDSDSESTTVPKKNRRLQRSNPSQKLINTETNTSEGNDARISELSDTSEISKIDKIQNILTDLEKVLTDIGLQRTYNTRKVTKSERRELRLNISNVNTLIELLINPQLNKSKIEGLLENINSACTSDKNNEYKNKFCEILELANEIIK